MCVEIVYEVFFFFPPCPSLPAAYLAEWPRKGRVATVELPADFPIGRPFFSLCAAVVPLTPAASPQETPAAVPTLRYSLVSATRTLRPGARSSRQSAPFDVHAVTGDVTLTDTLRENGRPENRPVEWNLVVEARVEAEGFENGSSTQLRVRLLSEEERAKICASRRKVCFGEEGYKLEYSIHEVARAGTVLDVVRPPAIAVVCPDSEPSYAVRQDDDNWLAVDESSGQLLLTRPVFWSESPVAGSTAVMARLVCSLAGHMNETAKVALQVKDLDNQPPRAQTESSLVCRKSVHSLHKGDNLDCVISVLDQDSTDANNFSVRVEQDNLNLFELDGLPFQTFITDKKMTFLNAKVIVRSSGAWFPGDKYNFAVVVEDVGLMRTDVPSKVTFQIEVSNSSTLRTPLSLRDTYNVSLSRNATVFARVLSSMTAPASNHRFQLVADEPSPGHDGTAAAHPWLAVTPRTGILYVSNEQRLRDFNASATSVLLQASWVEGEHGPSRPHLYRVEVHIQDAEGGSHTERCEGRLCGQQLSEAQCSASCGPGTLDGRCRWRHGSGGRHLTTRYSTCTGDPESCPDGTCDELELKHPTLCPQDCAEHVVGEAVAGPSGRGIEKAMGICSCASAESCTCTKPPSRPDSRDSVLAVPTWSHGSDGAAGADGQSVFGQLSAATADLDHRQEPGGESVAPAAAALCGPGCVASLCLAGLLVSVLALAALATLVRRRRAAAKHKYLGSRASLSVPSDYVDGRSAASAAAADAGAQASTPYPQSATGSPFLAKLQTSYRRTRSPAEGPSLLWEERLPGGQNACLPASSTEVRKRGLTRGNLASH
ncbi:hypothetical protein V5799_018106 [Amblyomma americanum]|uniref:RET cysteine rich domain-containing protein n=1 Tax=Amblyomma americanum TaxID=6943 RepID=A0AAQ4F1D2_AMBAM